MSDPRTELEKMHDAGATPVELCLAARSKGLGFLDKVRLLRRLKGLDYVQAKEVILHAEEGISLDEYQQSIARVLEEHADELLRDEPPGDAQGIL